MVTATFERAIFHLHGMTLRHTARQVNSAKNALQTDGVSGNTMLMSGEAWAARESIDGF